MTTMSKETRNRFFAIAAHKHAKMTASEMLDMCIAHGVTPEVYATNLELQLALVDAFDRYREALPNEETPLLLCKAVLASAYGISWLADKKPLTDFDEARALGQMLVDLFGSHACLSIIPPQPVAFPTTDTRSNVLN